MKQIIFSILYQPLYNALILLVWLMPGNNVGLAIILLTIFIRLALWPTNIKALNSQREMKALQPKMDEIRKKYDKNEQAMKLMELYKEHKINPYSGCLPLLIQLPIVYVLYLVFQAGLNTSHFDILYSFVPRPDTINTMFLGVDLSKPERWVFPIMTGVSQFIQFKQMQAITGPMAPKKDGQPDMAGMMNKQMMILGPAMSVFISMQLPAALPLYWTVTTLFAIVQQWWYFKNAPAIKFADSVKVDEDVKKLSSGDKQKPAKAERSLLQRVTEKKSKNKDVTVTIRRKGE